MNIVYENCNDIGNVNVKEIATSGFGKFAPIYSFTTESIAGYMPKLKISGANVLTIAGSGDHIINSILCGGAEVFAFDVNYIALLYVELKLVALENLTFQEFLRYFMINESGDIAPNKKAFDYEIYKSKIQFRLSQRAREFWGRAFDEYCGNGFELRNSCLFNNKYDKNSLKTE